MPRIGHKCYRFKVSEVCLITIVRLGRSVGRPPMLPCQKIRAQSLQGGPRGWQTGRRTHLEKVANELHHKTFLFIAPKRLNELSWNFLGTLCRCPKNMVSKKDSQNPDFGNGLPDLAQNFCVLSTYARHLVHPPKNPDPAVRLPENRINCLHYTGKS